MGLSAGENARGFYDYRRNIGHIPLRVYVAVRKNVQKQALRLGPLAGQVLERSENPAIVCRERATP